MCEEERLHASARPGFNGHTPTERVSPTRKR
jgi:hypothetical protein